MNELDNVQVGMIRNVFQIIESECIRLLELSKQSEYSISSYCIILTEMYKAKIKKIKY